MQRTVFLFAYSFYDMGIDLGGMLEATILGLYDWYLGEDEAVSYFKAF